MELDLVRIDNIPAEELFTADKLDDILGKVEDHVKSFVPDMETDKGRKEIASLAYKVSKTKTAIDGIGKELVSGWKNKAKKVDAHRKHARDFLDNLKEEVRQPLTEWEQAEKDRVENIGQRIEFIREDAEVTGWSAADIKKQIEKIESIPIDDSFMEFKDQAQLAKDATLHKLNEAYARQEKYEAEQAELERLRKEAAEREAKDREDRIRKEAAEKAQREAEEKAKAEQEQAEREKQESVKRQEEAERRAKEAEERAEKAAELARLQEKERAEKEAARLKAEEEKRQANKRHQKKIQGEAVAALMSAADLDKGQAEDVFNSVASGNIPHMAVKY